MSSRVEIRVNGRPYIVACDAGQEERIRELGAYIDGQVQGLKDKGVAHSDTTLLLLASIIITDELTEARARLETGGSGVAAAIDTSDLEDRLASAESALAAAQSRAADAERKALSADARAASAESRATQAVNRAAEVAERLAARLEGA